jgi:hypothetical protein
MSLSNFIVRLAGAAQCASGGVFVSSGLAGLQFHSV